MPGKERLHSRKNQDDTGILTSIRSRGLKATLPFASQKSAAIRGQQVEDGFGIRYMPLDPNNPWKNEGFLNPPIYGFFLPLKMKVLGSHGCRVSCHQIPAPLNYRSTSKTRTSTHKNPTFYLDHGHTPALQQNNLNPHKTKTQNPAVDGLALKLRHKMAQDGNQKDVSKILGHWRVPSKELTYPSWGEGYSSSNLHWVGVC